MILAPNHITDVEHMRSIKNPTVARDCSASLCAKLQGQAPLHLALFGSDQESADHRDCGSFYIPGITHKARCVSPSPRNQPARRRCAGVSSTELEELDETAHSSIFIPGITHKARCLSPPSPTGNKSANRLPRRTSCRGEMERSNDRRIQLEEEASASMSKLDSLVAETTMTGGQRRRRSILKDLQKDLDIMEQTQRRLRKKQKQTLHKLRKMQME